MQMYPDKGCEIKEFVVCKGCDGSILGVSVFYLLYIHKSNINWNIIVLDALLISKKHQFSKF